MNTRAELSTLGTEHKGRTQYLRERTQGQNSVTEGENTRVEFSTWGREHKGRTQHLGREHKGRTQYLRD